MSSVIVAQAASQHLAASWPWYIIRASGFLSIALLVLLMISGIGHVTGWTYHFIEPIKAWALHKAMAITLCISILVHCTMLLFDHFVTFNVADIAIPFVSHYTNGSHLLGLTVGSFAVASGILAAYGVGVIVASSLGWIDSKRGLWKSVHYISYLVMVLAFIHSLSTGSDLKHGLLRNVWIIILLLLIVAVVARVRRRSSSTPKV